MLQSLGHEKAGELVHRHLLRFYENKEAKAPKIIMYDLAFKFLIPYFRMHGYIISTSGYEKNTKTGMTSVSTLTFSKQKTVDVRAVKKFTALSKYSKIKYPITKTPNKIFFNKYILPYLPKNETIKVEKSSGTYILKTTTKHTNKDLLFYNRMDMIKHKLI